MRQRATRKCVRCASSLRQSLAVTDVVRFKKARAGVPLQDLAQDRAFWRDLLKERTSRGGLPAHSAGGYRNRRFNIIRGAAWVTLYRAKLPFPQIGVFL